MNLRTLSTSVTIFPPIGNKYHPRAIRPLAHGIHFPMKRPYKEVLLRHYATSDYNEDYAETVAYILFFPEFYERYIIDEENCTTDDCIARNEGRALIRRKYVTVLAHYEQVTGVDLLDVRAIVQDKLN